ncbi:MAG: 5-(carboxyamino)imidazole ribonucleotide synthase [Gemmatimonadota bacterium]
MRVGVLGGGQLGRMLALAGTPLGMRFRFLEEKSPAPVDGLGHVVRAPYDDPEALDRFSRGLDVVTYEFENVPVRAVERIRAHGVALHPSPSALAMAQDRLAEKAGFAEVGIPTAPFRPVDSLEDLERAAAEVGLPAVLKTRRFGYDGKGQVVLRDAADAGPAFEALGGVPLILEGFVDFRRELSVLGVRGEDGACSFYPLVENVHREGILWTSVAPAPDVQPEVEEAAQRYGRALMEHHNYVGVLAIELFETADRLLANEMAPRVHNSGHWTQDGAWISQFENHLRAVCGYPLGSTAVRGYSAMVNLVGSSPTVRELLTFPDIHLHLYDKTPRPRRKLGHVNLVRESREALMSELEELKAVCEVR